MNTVGQMIDYLKRLDRNMEVNISIRDYFTTYGKSGKFLDFNLSSNIYKHIVNDNQLTLKCYIEDKKFNGEIKHPKIIYRK